MPIDTASTMVTHSNEAKQRSCPLCRGELIRTWRRPVDRFTSLFNPIRRYRCEDFSCQWEGNLHTHQTASQDRAARAAEGRSSGMSGLLVVEVLIIITATLFIAAFSTSDMWSVRGSGTVNL